MKKTKIMLAGLTLLSVMAFASFAAVSAADYNIVDYQVSTNGNVWTISTKNTLQGGPFSGKSATNIQVVYWLDDGDEKVLNPIRIHKTEGKITLYFDSAETRPLRDTVEGGRVTGDIVGGGTFIATGPGFAWGRRR